MVLCSFVFSVVWILSLSSLRLASLLQIVFHKWCDGERRRTIGHDATDYPLYLAIKKIVYLFQHCTTNLMLRLLLASLLLIQTTNIFKIDGNDVLSFYMCLHCYYMISFGVN